MKSLRVRPLSLGEGHRSQSDQSTTTASRDPRWDLIIAAIHLVFVSVFRSFTGVRLRPCGGPAIMIMHPVNSGAGVPGIGGIRGVPVITGTKGAPLPHPWSIASS